MSRRRPREDENEGAAAGTSMTTSTASSKPKSLFSIELEKRVRALQEQCNGELKRKIVSTSLESNTQNAQGIPEYKLWSAVAEYKRVQREIELRYGGRVGEVYCFGSNDMYQQGLPDLTDLEEQQVDNMTPHKLGIKLEDIRQVRAGGTSLAALNIHGQVFTWGSCDDGALGRVIPENVDKDKAQATPTLVKGFVTAEGIVEDGQITQIDMGAAHIIHLTAAGNVYFNGFFKDNDSGMFSPTDPKHVIKGAAPDEPPHYQLAEGEEPPRQPDTYGIIKHKATPIHIKLLKEIVAVYSGGNFCAVLTKDRQVLTFGFGCMGELARSPSMAKKDASGNFDLTTNFFKNKKADSWGWLNMDLLRDKFLTPLPVQYESLGKRQVLNLACGAWHLLVVAMDEDGTVRLYSSGLNQYGQLGLGDHENRHVLTKVPFFDGTITPGQVAAGEHHSLTLSHGGDALFAYGRADYGQLGIGPQKAGEGLTTPERVQIPHGVLLKQIAAGDSASFVSQLNVNCELLLFQKLTLCMVLEFYRQPPLTTNCIHGVMKALPATVASIWRRIVLPHVCSEYRM